LSSRPRTLNCTALFRRSITIGRLQQNVFYSFWGSRPERASRVIQCEDSAHHVAGELTRREISDHRDARRGMRKSETGKKLLVSKGTVKASASYLCKAKATHRKPSSTWRYAHQKGLRYDRTSSGRTLSRSGTYLPPIPASLNKLPHNGWSSFCIPRYIPVEGENISVDQLSKRQIPRIALTEQLYEGAVDGECD
jgi:hypothetical protein